MLDGLPKSELGIWRGRGSKHWRSAYAHSASKPLSTPPRSRRSSITASQSSADGRAPEDNEGGVRDTVDKRRSFDAASLKKDMDTESMSSLVIEAPRNLKAGLAEKKINRQGSSTSSLSDICCENKAGNAKTQAKQVKSFPKPGKDEGWIFVIPLKSGHMFVRRLPTLVTGIAIHGKKCHVSTCNSNADWEVLKGIKSETEPSRYAHIRDEGDQCDWHMRFSRSFWGQEAAICGADP